MNNAFSVPLLRNGIIVVPPRGLLHPTDVSEFGLTGTWHKRPWRILISSTWVRERIAGLAREIIHYVQSANNASTINLLIILDGGDYFGRRLAREIRRAGRLRTALHFLKASSYGAAQHSSGRCKISGNISRLADKDVIVVDDIRDTGLTLMNAIKYLAQKAHASSVKTCILLDKSKPRSALLAKCPADFVGFKVPNCFLAGCGMDLGAESHFRRLPYIIALKRKTRRHS